MCSLCVLIRLDENRMFSHSFNTNRFMNNRGYNNIYYDPLPVSSVPRTHPVLLIFDGSRY